MPIRSPETFRKLVEDVGRQLVSAEHDDSGSFLSVPLVYPSGTGVVVRVEGGGDNRFFVSDSGFGAQEADLMGASQIYGRHARMVAEISGIRFDNQAFFIVEAERDQIAGAVVAVANCSQEAAIRTADALAEKTFDDAKEKLYQRLISIFDKKTVTKNAEIHGSSATEYRVAALVRNSGSGPIVVFDPVTKHHSSVAHATMKFSDMARLEVPPIRVAVVHRKPEFGTLLGVLSQSANVIDDSVPNATLLRFASAA